MYFVKILCKVYAHRIMPKDNCVQLCFKVFLVGCLMIQMALPKKKRRNKTVPRTFESCLLMGMLMVQFVVCKALCTMYCLEFIVSCF